ncbi:MAG: C40 family peptidase [Victivallales bacterium]|jgi:hypothetical protein|nr:C40 family peptidase [Victivallales bacterium]
MKKLFFCLQLLAPLVLIFALLWPVNNGITRYLIVFGVLDTWGMLIYLVWRRRWLRITVLAVPLVFAFLIAVVPGTPDVPRLHQTYLQELRNYEGTRYLWGGENKFGIDCSGLPRKALRVAMFRHGFSGILSMFRASLQNWWFDASVAALTESYRDYTVPLNLSGTVATAQEDQLKPGDLAIYDNGLHAMVYLGPDEWISADPDLYKVVIEHPSQSKNPRFTRPVHFYRWSEL